MSLLRDFIASKHCSLALLKAFMEDGVPESLLTVCTPSDWCQKSISEAKKLRDLGNESYRSKNYEEALTYYSKSVATAPIDCGELALAYGNRSAVLWVKKDYELCLLDCNRALNGSLPQSSRQTLLERKKKAWERLQNQNNHRVFMRGAFLHTIRTDQHMANLKACQRKLCYDSKVNRDDTDLTIDYSQSDSPIWNTKFDNVFLPNVSSNLELKNNTVWGRHFVATKDIDPGEVLFIEEFYSLKLSEDMQYTHCGYCMVWCEALIPCSNCTQEMYCCIGCREKAYDSYHRTECKMLPVLHTFTKEERQRRLLALRMFLIGTKQGCELTKLMNDPRVYHAIDGNLNCVDVQYSLKDYVSILNLFWRVFKEYDAPNNCVMLKEVFSVFMPLRYIHFFGGEKNETQPAGNILTEEELFVTLLLTHHISLMIHYRCDSNVWFIESLEGPTKVKEEKIGLGLGTWLNFMNHSCDANSMEIFDKRRILTCSLRPINAGEQVFSSNGASYVLQNRETRQHYLKGSHNIDCRCIACIQDWPLLNGLMRSRNTYLTTHQGMITQIEKIHQWLMTKLDYSFEEADLVKVSDFIKTIRQHVKEPSPTIFLAEQFINRLMKAKGNIYFTPKFIASLQIDF